MEVLKVSHPREVLSAIDRAIYILERGGTIVYPTDTLYCLGSNALEDRAIRKVFEIKERSFLKPLPLIARDIQWVRELAFTEPKIEELLSKIWPGRVTAVLKKKNIVPNLLTSSQDTVGIRVPNYRFLDELLRRYGYPIVSTSAAVSGEEPTQDPEDITADFIRRRYRPDLIIDVGILPSSDPSAVVDFTGTQPRILRIGPSKPNQLMKILGM